MALKSSRSQAQLLCDAVTELICNYGTDGRATCLAYCKIGERIVGHFFLNEREEPQVCLANDKGETISLPARDFNVRECRAIREAVSDTVDAINYRRCCDGINRQTELATAVEKSMMELFKVSGKTESMVVSNRVPLKLDGEEVVIYAFNPEENKNLGGQYEIHLSDGRCQWVWNLSNTGLEKVLENVKANIEVMKASKTKVKASGLSM